MKLGIAGHAGQVLKLCTGGLENKLENLQGK